MAHSLTTCTFCGVGCGLYLETAGNHVRGVYPSMSHPSNEGKICVRGWNVHEVASSPDRLRQPLVRKDGELRETTWDEAIGFIRDRLLAIRDKHGPDALAFFNAPRCSNEESYLLQKLARAVIGTNNIDTGTGVYSHNSIHVLKEMLGWPATTSSIGDLSKSDVILVDGVDLGMQLPTIGGCVMRAKLAGAKLIVIDARRHRVAEHADHLLQLRPGTDVTLYGAMAKVIVDRGLAHERFIKAHCREYEAFLRATRRFDLLNAAEVCGVPAETIEAAALAYAKAGKASLLYSTGAEVRDVDSIRGIVNLALLRGNLGKEGAGLFALTEHNNSQGAADMGLVPDLLPGYLPVSEVANREALGALWQVALPDRPGVGAREFFENEEPDRFKAAWLCRYDPVNTATFCDAGRVLKDLDLVVVQHLFKVATADYADVVLPVVAFGEEQVTFTSTERRIQVARKVSEPPEGPIPAWRQIMMVARALGSDWRYLSAADVMDEIAEVVPFYGGATHENLLREYGRQWPCTKDKPLGTRDLFEGALPERGLTFVPITLPTAPASESDDHPLALIFGQSLYYWHQNVLVRNSETLKREHRVLLMDYPEGFVEINDEDAKGLEIRDGERIRLVSPQGEAETFARVTREVRTGTVFVPFFLREVERAMWGREQFGLGNLSKPVPVRVEKA